MINLEAWEIQSTSRRGNTIEGAPFTSQPIYLLHVGVLVQKHRAIREPRICTDLIGKGGRATRCWPKPPYADTVGMSPAESSKVLGERQKAKANSIARLVEGSATTTLGGLI